HPGYGFLSEQASFAEACAAAGVVFVGPPPGAMRAIKDKAQARTVMRDAGVPVAPGSEGHVTPDAALDEARALGFPLLVNAARGGTKRSWRRRPPPLSSCRRRGRTSARSCCTQGSPRRARSDTRTPAPASSSWWETRSISSS